MIGVPGRPITAARPSTAVLRPLRLQCLNRIGQQTRGMHLGQLYNPKLYNPWRCCHSVGKGLGGDQHMQYSTVFCKFGIIYTQTHFPCTHDQKWLGFFEIRNHIHANAFSLYTLSQIICKWLISYCMCFFKTKY